MWISIKLQPNIWFFFKLRIRNEDAMKNPLLV